MERIPELIAAQKDLAKIMQDHGESLAGLAPTIRQLQEAVSKLSATVEKHELILNEYTGARKVLHWIIAAGTGLAGYFAGRGGHHP